ncbi:MAG: efflux RND transporter periplasmic adaptor subunit [Ignavibacteriaceae bacterium]
MKNKIYLLGFTIIIPLLISACSSDKGAQQKFPPTPVTAYEVKYGIASYYDEYPATVIALNQVEIRPEVSGYLTGIYFKDGQHVTKGMKLYTIDQQQYKAAYEQAVANLNVAKSNLIKAKQDADRYSELAKKDAIARQVLEHAQADLESAKMQVAAAEENVKGVQTNLLYSIIEAPFDGTIGISSVKLGSSVSTGQTLLNTISSDNPMAVDFAVDEKQIGRFTELLNKKTGAKDSTFTIILPDQSLYPFPGHLSLLDRAVDPQTGTITARLIFPNTKNLLRPGLTCDVRVQNISPANSILIPYDAVTEQMGEYFVFVINGNKVSQRKVSLGRTINNLVIVNEGLKPGEKIVTEGMQKLRDNSPVIIVPSGTKPNSQTAYIH